MTALAWVAVGALGGAMAIARFLVDSTVATRLGAGRFGGDFPVGTLAVNLSGARGPRRPRRRGALRHRLHDPRRRRGRHLHHVLDLDAGVAPRRRGRRRAGALGEHRACRWSPGSPRWRSATGSGARCERGEAAGRDAAAALPLRRARPATATRPLEAAVMDACARRGVERGGAAARGRGLRREAPVADRPAAVAVAKTRRWSRSRWGRRRGVEGLAEEIAAMAGEGLIVPRPPAPPPLRRLGRRMPSGRGRGTLVKATVWGPRSGSGSPHLAAVAAFHAHGAEAATVLLGVDGVLGGERRRARFVGANRGVPAITVAVGERGAIEAALAGARRRRRTSSPSSPWTAWRETRT